MASHVKLSLLCVTTLRDRTKSFIDDMAAVAERVGAEFVLAVDGKDVHSKGYIESVLDDALALTHGEYILRLDDDERCSPAMIEWLAARSYEEHDHWSFPRVHLWKSPDVMIVDAPFYPDFQTRLSVRAKSGNRPIVHQGSPFGFGTIAKVCIEHWQFLAKTQQEMAETSAFYQSLIEQKGHTRFAPDPHETSWPITIGEYKYGLVPLNPSWTAQDKIR